MLRGINEEIAFPILLGRPEIKSSETIFENIKGKVVLITGAGGSIGSEIVKQVLESEPAHVIMLDLSEYNLYEVNQTVEQSGKAGVVTALVGDIKDTTQLRRIFRRMPPQIVIHAAALKHVPLMQEPMNALEAVRTNYLGTKRLARVCSEWKVETFVFVSTDKAVHPTSLMGASKRAAELFLHNFETDMKMVVVRFGNVWGSSGSVVPLFRRQIAQGGPVTVTHPDMTRFFMTITEAVDLVLHASSLERGAYILEMGEPVKIAALAEQLIRMSGSRPGKDVKIEFTGLRAGEKLYEELNYAHEVLEETKYPAIRKISNPGMALEDGLEEEDIEDSYTALEHVKKLVTGV